MRFPQSITALILLGSLLATARTELPSIALLPLMNYSGDQNARFAVNSAIDSVLRRDFPLAEAANVELVLRDYRIRETTRLSAREIDILGAELNVDFLLCGTIQSAWRDDDGQELAVAMRLIDVQSKEVRWAYSAGQRAVRSETLSDILFHSAKSSPLNGVTRDVSSALRRALRSEPKILPDLIAVVPLQNLSNTRFAGDIATNELVAVLVRKKLRVLDPGVVAHLIGARTRGFAQTPGIEVMADIQSAYGANKLVTGELTDFEPPHEDRREEPAKVAVALRVVTLAQGNVVASSLNSIGESSGYQLFGVRTENRIARACHKVLNQSVTALHIQNLHE